MAIPLLALIMQLLAAPQVAPCMQRKGWGMSSRRSVLGTHRAVQEKWQGSALTGRQLLMLAGACGWAGSRMHNSYSRLHMLRLDSKALVTCDMTSQYRTVIMYASICFE